MICISGNASLSFFRFSSEFGKSALFAAISIGFVVWRRVVVKFFRSWLDHEVGWVGSSFRIDKTLFMWNSFTLRPENCLATVFAKSVFVDWIVLDNFSQTFEKICSYHLFNSPSNIWTSSIGFPSPS